jgi:putative component of toxin-antitoxin plasmid stabilization module
MDYIRTVIEVRQTEIFARWLTNLRDGRTRARINSRIVDFRSAMPATQSQLAVAYRK